MVPKTKTNSNNQEHKRRRTTAASSGGGGGGDGRYGHHSRGNHARGGGGSGNHARGGGGSGNHAHGGGGSGNHARGGGGSGNHAHGGGGSGNRAHGGGSRGCRSRGARGSRSGGGSGNRARGGGSRGSRSRGARSSSFGHSGELGLDRTWANITCGRYGDLGEWFGEKAENEMSRLLAIKTAFSLFTVSQGLNLRMPDGNVGAEIDHLVWCSLSEPPSGLHEFVAWLEDPRTTAYIFDVKAVFHMCPGTSKWKNYTRAPTTKAPQMQRYADWNALPGVYTFYMMMCPDVGDHHAALMSPTVVNVISWLEETPELRQLKAHNNTGVGIVFPGELDKMRFIQH